MECELPLPEKEEVQVGGKRRKIHPKKNEIHSFSEDDIEVEDLPLRSSDDEEIELDPEEYREFCKWRKIRTMRRCMRRNMRMGMFGPMRCGMYFTMEGGMRRRMKQMCKECIREEINKECWGPYLACSRYNCGFGHPQCMRNCYRKRAAMNQFRERARFMHPCMVPPCQCYEQCYEMQPHECMRRRRRMRNRCFQ